MSITSHETRTVTVNHPNGLHMRPAGMVAQLCRKFESRIEIAKGELRVDGKDTLAILTLFAGEGVELQLHASGPDAADAVSKVAELIGSDFSDELPGNRSQ
jgi:phosphocarrier protein